MNVGMLEVEKGFCKCSYLADLLRDLLEATVHRASVVSV